MNLSDGPVIWEEDIGGKYYRLVITEVEIYQHLYIEKLLTDTEGYNRKIVASLHMDFAQLIGNISVRSIEIIQWISQKKVIVAIDDEIYRLKFNDELTEATFLKLD